MRTKVKTKKTIKPVRAVKSNKKSIPQESEVLPKVSEEKRSVIEEFAIKKGDTGSPEVQIALLSKRIEKLVGHLKTNPADNHSRRGLLGMVSKRRRLLNYLSKKAADRFKDISKKLDLGRI